MNLEGMGGAEMIRGYQDLAVWQRAMDLAVLCYELSAGFPRSEVYGLTWQLRKAAASVPANIAEGRGRKTTGDFLRFLSVANGSLTELETHVLLAERLRFADAADTAEVLSAAAEVGRMLHGLRSALEARARRNRASSPGRLRN